MVKTKLYLSVLIFLLSALWASAVLFDDNKITVVAYANDDIKVEETSNTTTTKKTTTTTTKKQTTTTKTTKVNTTKVVNNSVGTMNISNYNKTYYIKQDDGSRKLLDGNTYGMMDSRTSFDYDKMIIYGHSNNDGTGLFQYFQKYDGNKSFYDNHKYITINYDGVTYKYVIFSVYNAVLDKTEESNEYYMTYRYYNTYIYNNVLQGYKKNSQYDTGIEVDYNDKILVIQTCSMNKNYKGKKVNLLIMGKLIETTKENA